MRIVSELDIKTNKARHAYGAMRSVYAVYLLAVICLIAWQQGLSPPAMAQDAPASTEKSASRSSISKQNGKPPAESQTTKKNRNPLMASARYRKQSVNTQGAFCLQPHALC
ncbi:hypothetical protein AD953_07320 [Acetobacter malorum]|uniref:Uncharacterized protein n=1 Tax=Acetobacter malorum TaxID=178901 RepID=A0A149V5M5_9PROT|nr:hypothetical protein AD953_07320 [Acetobacter malorum]